MKVLIYPNLLKQNNRKYTERACGILYSENAEIYMDCEYADIFGELYGIKYMKLKSCVEQCDVIVVTGGDGTILRCASIASRYNKPILGINCGTLGFMASLENSEMEKLILLCRGEYKISERMMLSITVKRENGEELHADALNDAVIFKGEDCKIVDFEVTKAESTVSSLRADGIIFSTATGATAYALSAGGPIIEPEMQCIEFSQICAHSLFARSVIFSPDSVLKVNCLFRNEAHTVLTVDGNVLAKISQRDTVIIKRSELKTGIIDITGGSFFSALNRKLMTPLKEN
ncbi:MAG: NAD(+)/NADH kinase [Oscillospiraceae bacterium]